jgi:hypothetical protein
VIRILVACLATVVLVVSCGSLASNESRIAGKWQIVNGDTTLQFFGGTSTGTVARVSSGLFGPVTSEGQFNWLDSESVRLQFPGLFSPESIIYTVSISGNRMTLVTSTGYAAEYQRVSQ